MTREDELIEELAQALYSAFWKGSPPIPTEVAVHLAATRHFSSEAPIDKAWIEVGRECLRQMEWAQRRGIRHGLICRGLHDGLVTDSSSGKAEISAIAKHDPLVQAPRDWKP